MEGIATMVNHPNQCLMLILLVVQRKSSFRDMVLGREGGEDYVVEDEYEEWMEASAGGDGWW